jgi:hypothetical protein
MNMGEVYGGFIMDWWRMTGGDGGALRSFSVGEAAESVRVLTTGILIR